MKRLSKWLLTLGGLFVALLIAAVVILPQFVDIQKYKPEIEKLVVEQTGRPFSMGEEMDLSVFPWIGVKLTDLKVGNPAGFQDKEMVTVKNFEVRLKMLPLLSKRLEVKTFVLDKPVISLEIKEDGATNWAGIGQKNKATVAQKDGDQPAGSKRESLPISSLLVGNFSISNGSVKYVNHAANVDQQITDFNVSMRDISLEKPMDITVSAMIDDNPFVLEGNIGPIGKEPGKGNILLDLQIKAFDEINLKLSGEVSDVLSRMAYDLNIDLAPFSPKKIMTAMGQPFPIDHADPGALQKIGLKTRLQGDLSAVSITGGVLKLDDSNLLFEASAKEFQKPNLTFTANLDQIDLDRYLPEKKNTSQEGMTQDKGQDYAAANPVIDYSPLRKLELSGNAKAGKLKVSNATMQNVNLAINAKNGIITVNPFTIDLYQGNALSKVEINIQKNSPKTSLSLTAINIQAKQLLNDIAKIDVLDGTAKADMNLQMVGDTPDQIKQTLAGNGELLFTDGAIVGIDLANLVRNITSKIGVGEKVEQKPRTDFAELKVPFSLGNGQFETPGASLASPLIRVLVVGKADLIQELLDFKIEPKFVATLKGQGDNKDRSGLMVPVLASGTFSDPKIRPDFQGILTGAGVPSIDSIKNMAESNAIPKVDTNTMGSEVKSVEQGAKNLIKGFLPGMNN